MAQTQRGAQWSKEAGRMIRGDRIYLRKLTEKDATPRYASWLNDPEVNRYLETKKATVEGLKRYIKEKNASLTCLFFGIFLKENHKHIGNIKLEPIDWKNRKATLGILIGDKEHRGKGLGTEAVKSLADWALDGLKLNEINLGVIPENTAAIRAYEKAGFRCTHLNDGKSCERAITEILKAIHRS